MPSIVSRLPDRMRIRHKRLRDIETLEIFCADLRRLSGVLEVRGNKNAGSVTIYYDERVISSASLEEIATVRAIELMGRSTGTGAPSAPKSGQPLSLAAMNLPIKIGMAASLAATLGTLAVGRRSHAIAGTALTAFLLLHMATYRRTLFR